MASSNKGLIAVIGGGIVLGLSFALGYLFYFLPREKAEAAAAEIAEWGESWKSARTCLLGEPAPSPNPQQALVARELVSRDLRRALEPCQAPLKKLSRKQGYSTDHPNIEDAWVALRRPRTQVAQAHAWAAAKEPNKPADQLRANLAKAIVDLDAAHNALRAASDLPPVSYESKEIVSATTTTSLRGPDDIKMDISEVKLEADYITYHAIDKHEVVHWGQLTPEGQRFYALSPLALRAVDADWGLWFESDGIPQRWGSPGTTLRAGPLDAQGEPGGDGTILHTIADNESATLSFAIGDAERAALYKIERDEGDSYVFEYVLQVSSDGGKTFTKTPLPADEETFVQLQETGDKSYIMWTGAPADGGKKLLHWLRLQRDGVTKESYAFPASRGSIGNFAQWPPYVCQAPKRSWWVLEGQVFVSEAGTLRPVGDILQDVLNYQQTLRCTNDSVSVASRRRNDKDQSVLGYQVCTTERCDPKVYFAPLPADGSYHVVFYQGAWRVVTALQGLAAVWSGDSESPAAIVELPDAATIYGAVTWQDKLNLLVWPPAEGPSLLTLPKVTGL